MRIAVVGAGAAGLTCAWLLGPEHEVVCYEALPTAGGNGRNAEIEVEGRLVVVTPGSSLFPPAMALGREFRVVPGTLNRVSAFALQRLAPRRAAISIFGRASVVTLKG